MANSKIEVTAKVSASKQNIGGNGKGAQGKNVASGNDPKKGVGGDFSKVGDKLKKAMSDMGQKISDSANKIIKSNSELGKDLKQLKTTFDKVKNNIGNAVANPGASTYAGAKGLSKGLMASIPGIGFLIGGAMLKTFQQASAYRSAVSDQASTIGIAGLQTNALSSAFDIAGSGAFLKSAKVSSGNLGLLDGVSSDQLSRISNYKLKYGAGNEDVGSLVGVAGGVGGFDRMMDMANRTGAGTQTQEFMNEMKSVLEQAVKDGMDESEVASISQDLGNSIAKFNIGNKNNTIELAVRMAKSMKSIRDNVASGDISDPAAYKMAVISKQMLESVDQATIDEFKKQGVYDMTGVKAGDDLTQKYDASTIGAMIQSMQAIKGGQIEDTFLKNLYSSAGGDFGRFNELVGSYLPNKDINSSMLMFKRASGDDKKIDSILDSKGEINKNLEKDDSKLNTLTAVNNLRNAEANNVFLFGPEALKMAVEFNKKLEELLQVLKDSGGVEGAITGLTELLKGIMTGVKELVASAMKMLKYFNILPGSGSEKTEVTKK